MVSTSGCAMADEVDPVGHLFPVIGVGDEENIAAELVEWPLLKGSRVEYPTATDGAYLSSTSSRPCFFDLSSAGRVWNDNLLLVSGEYLQRFDEEPLELNNRILTKDKYTIENRTIICMLNYIYIVDLYLSLPTFYIGISCKVSRKESFIDVVAREGTELEAILKELEISRFKRVDSKDDKVRRSQAKRRMAGKTPGTMEEKLLTPELNTPLKLARINEMPDGPVDMATVFNTVVRNLAKRKAVKRGAASCSVTLDSVDDRSKRRKVTSPTKSQVVLEERDKIAKEADLRLRFEVEASLLEEQCRAKAQEKMVAAVDEEFKKFARALRGVQLGLQDRSIELEKRIFQLEGEKNHFKENLTREKEAFQLEQEKEREAATLKLKKLRAESVVEAERLVTTSATSQNNLAGKLYKLRYTKAEILAFSEGNYEEKEIMDEEEVEEMEDCLNVAEKTAADNLETIDQEIESSRLRVVDLEGLLEVKKKASTKLQKELDVFREREEQILLYNAEYAEEYEALISQYEDRLDDNVKLSLKLEEAKSQVEDMTAIILSRDLALNQLSSELAELKEKATSGSRHEVELAEYHIRALNDEISDMKCNIRGLNEQLLIKEIDLDIAQTDLDVSEANFEKFNSGIVGKDLELRNFTQIRDSLIARNVRRAVQRDKEMNERINQLCARISELEWKLRVRELKYEKDLKFELDKKDGKIASGEGSREMKEFFRRKEELVENMRIDVINSQQKLIDLTRQMSKRIDPLTAELVESKARCLRDNKHAVVTHQSFKEQVERDLMQDCFSGRTFVCKLDISSIDPIEVMDRGIGATTAEQIARGREIVAARAPEYMASRTEKGESSSTVSPTPAVGGRSTSLPLRKSSIIKRK
ncbi:hypothetical protein GIB67_024384 [Kingdonia uniflora]|uniref:Uncharacterized protein n=1 Tax=Kingdonia uniflora TaxID=39325 RepID=A0A7J7LFI4_9MAGN|nr:hypothetical protein GIB67_024384 [Kingdonia uniflora]